MPAGSRSNTSRCRIGKHRLPALFCKAPGSGRTPCVVHFDGLDVTKEIIYASMADEFRRRGISLLIVDHPGVGGALRLLGLTSGPDTEKPAGAAVDYLETRSDVERHASASSRSRSADITHRVRRHSRSASNVPSHGARSSITGSASRIVSAGAASLQCRAMPNT